MRWMRVGCAMLTACSLGASDAGSATAPASAAAPGTTAGAATPPSSASAAPASSPETLPGIYFVPSEVSFTQNLVMPKGSGETSSGVIMLNQPSEANELRLRFLTTTDEHWLILAVEDPVLVDALTATGETLGEAAISDFRGNAIFFDGNPIRQAGGTPQYINLSLTTPHQPTTSLKLLVATVDLVLAKDDSIKTTTVRIGADDSDPLPIEGNDMTFRKVDGRVEIKYGPHSFGMIKSLNFIDSNGQPCFGHMAFQRFVGTSYVSSLQFPNRNVTSAVIEYFGTTRIVQATARLSNVPLIGVSSPRQLEPHRADAVHEVPAHALPPPRAGRMIIINGGIAVPVAAPLPPPAPAANPAPAAAGAKPVPAAAPGAPPAPAPAPAPAAGGAPGTQPATP